MPESLLILGASVRAAAQSAARTGLRPYCGDLYCDADLPDIALRQVARSFSGDLLRIAETSPPGPWMYTGGLENYPWLVERISRRHELLGTGADALRRVRDPFELGRVLGAAGLFFPECRRYEDGIMHGGGWLLKHRGSSGGQKVLLSGENTAAERGRGWYYQRRVEGLAVGAVYVATQGKARLLGVTEQLLTGSCSRPFRYAGSIGPLALTAWEDEAMRQTGDVLAAGFSLHGLFGVDFIIDHERVWVIEVNPRYTASVEVLERAFGFNAVDLHIAACHGRPLPPIESSGSPCIGKCIVYANEPCTISAEQVQALQRRNRGRPWPAVADIPRAGTQIDIGQPILTVFAEGTNRLRRHA